MAGSSSTAVFQWGNKEAGTESSYESMCYNGVWYHLYDCIFCRSGRRAPFVGKLMRLFEEEGARKVRIRWFFRPYELPASVIKDLPRDILNSNELFIALGSVKGVENENAVEVIRGKATVLCTVRYGRNMIPAGVLIDAADHVFNRAYDVAKQKLVKMASIQNKQLAEKFVNKSEWLVVGENAKVEEARSSTLEESKSSSSSSSTRKFGLVASKRQLVRTSSIDSCISQGKKMKGKEKNGDDQSRKVANLEIVDLDMLSE